jgi:preprotein translocase subunit YajC
MGSLIILVATFGLLWALLILPQQRRVRAQQALVAAVEQGDEVMTTAGIFGRVTAVDGDQIRLEVAPGIELRMMKGAIARRVTSQEELLDLGEGAASDTEHGEDDAELDTPKAPPVVQPRRGVLRRRPDPDGGMASEAPGTDG